MILYCPFCANSLNEPLHRGISFWADPPLVEPGSGRWRTLSLLPG